jgi:hypothetical protein
MADSAKQFLVIDENGKGHLPVRDSAEGPLNHAKMGGAWAALHAGFRGNVYEGPDKAQAIAKLKGLYEEENMPMPAEGTGHRGQMAAAEDLIYGRAILLDELPRAGGDGLRELPIALVGNWIYQGKPFSLTEDDLKTIVGNFSKRKNGEINIDYDHASEEPEVGRGGPIPSAGRVVRLRSDRVLHGGVEFTERAEQLIDKKEYRYFSPAIYRNYPDKQTGKDQGMTLHTVALTNTPFLEELPAIRLSEIDGEPRKEEAGNLKLETGGRNMDPIVATKLTDGKYQIARGTEVLGSVEIPQGPDEKAILGSFSERLGAKGKSEAEIKALVESAGKFLARETRETAHKLLASECVKDGKLDRDRMKVLARESKVGMEDFLAFEDAFAAVDEAVKGAKILPKDREYFVKVALSDIDGFKKFAEKAPKVIDLTVRGVGGEGLPGEGTKANPARGIEVDPQSIKLSDRAEAIAAERKIEFGEALKLARKELGATQ